jgi:hypothetical protein
VTIYYKKINDDQVYQQVVTLNKTYANVSNALDGPLQTGFREKIDSEKTITIDMNTIE